MKTQIERAHLLKNLHVKGDPLILFNIWDAGSAEAIQQTGAKAIATGSWSVAKAHGYEDGEKLPFDLAITNLKRITDNVTLPVTFDFEGGYGQSPEEVKNSLTKVIEAGAVGVNFEDQMQSLPVACVPPWSLFRFQASLKLEKPVFLGEYSVAWQGLGKTMMDKNV